MMHVRRRQGGGLAVVAAIAGTLALLTAGKVSAVDATPPSPERGLELAHRLCQGCHVTGNTDQAKAIAGVPPFRTIANKPGQSGDHIKSILIKPHAPMPDMHLTSAEILDIIAYLDTLRSDPKSPSLLPAGPPGSKGKDEQPS